MYIYQQALILQPSSLHLSPSCWGDWSAAGGMHCGLELQPWIGTGTEGGWGGLHPTQTQSLHSAHAARLAAGMPRPGGRNFLLEDLPEKCQAGSDEERNLDGER